MINKIKYLRNMLGLTQKEFGKKLGVSRDAIANIELNRTVAKEHFLRHICDVFSVNEDWIFNGLGSVFAEPEPAQISALKTRYGLSEEEIEIMKKYLSLEPDQQKIVSALIENLTSLLPPKDDR